MNADHDGIALTRLRKVFQVGAGPMFKGLSPCLAALHYCSGEVFRDRREAQMSKPITPTLSGELACLLRMKASGAALRSQGMNSVDK